MTEKIAEVSASFVVHEFGVLIRNDIFNFANQNILIPDLNGRGHRKVPMNLAILLVVKVRPGRA